MRCANCFTCGSVAFDAATRPSSTSAMPSMAAFSTNLRSPDATELVPDCCDFVPDCCDLLLVPGELDVPEVPCAKAPMVNPSETRAMASAVLLQLCVMV